MISKFFIDRPIVAMVISIVMVIVGAVAMATLPISQFPGDYSARNSGARHLPRGRRPHHDGVCCHSHREPYERCGLHELHVLHQRQWGQFDA